MNARVLSSVVADADRIYRERFLRERYGLDLEMVLEAVDEEPDVIDIAEIPHGRNPFCSPRRKAP